MIAVFSIVDGAWIKRFILSLVGINDFVNILIILN